MDKKAICLKKYVYLFELDSVRNTNAEIEIGQKALYNEIVVNGNVVVLTFNQLVDSRGFFSLLNNQEYYNNIVELFKAGSIRISQYGDIRTISQYLLSSFDYDKEFIYSGWPLKSTQKRLLALIKRSLTYSDLSEINDYCIGKRTNQEILDLFVEVNSDKSVKETPFEAVKCLMVLKSLYWLLKTVLRLSAIHSIYIPPRDTGEYSNLKLHNILEIIDSLDCVNNDERLKESLRIIKSLPCYGSDNRSNYLHCLLERSNNNQEVNKALYQYSEAIINLAYNYACEISICNISKHYDIDELTSKDIEPVSFETDFLKRLEQYWQLEDYENRFLLSETSEYDEYSPSKQIPDFSKAVRLIGYLSHSHSYQPNDVQRYENGLKSQRMKHKSTIIAAIGKRVIFSLICFMIAFGVEVLFQVIQNSLDDTVNLSALWWIAIETFSFICVTELLSSGFSWLLKKFFNIDFLTFADALGEIGKLIRDAGYIVKEKAETYFNPCSQHSNNIECFSEGVPIEFVKSSPIKKYLKLRQESECQLFSSSDIYPLARTDDVKVIKELARTEELFNYQFGVVYKSKYNTMVVDPIKQYSGTQISYYPYERIIPTFGNGVVMVTVHNDRFVFLKQYRHAPRKTQFSFPRGYGERGILSVDNAMKELSEELNATITSVPTLIGRITPDSGLTSSCVSVYLVNIDDYEKTGEEGIIDVTEIPVDEFEDRIYANVYNDQNEFDDGFTLAAYLLYKLRLSRA